MRAATTPLALGLALCGCFALAAPAAAEMPAAQRAEIETLIKDYILRNPEIVQEALDKVARAKALAEQERRKAALASNAQAIFSSPHQVTLGDANGRPTLVEFFDYNCGYCKRALPNKLELLQTEPKLKVVLKELPVLGKNSVDAARVAVAVRMQDPGGKRYLEFHTALLTTAGPIDQARALAAAKAAGLDMVRLEQDLASSEVTAALDESSRLAASLGIRGTPSYVIGDEVVPGAVSLAVLKEKLSRATR